MNALCRRTTRHLIALFLAPLSIFAVGIGAPVMAAREAPTPDDLARLSRGEVLFKAELPSADGAPAGNGGTAMALLEAREDRVWAILTDFSHYAGLFPRLKGSEIVNQTGGRTCVRFLVAAGPFNFRFAVNHVVLADERRIRWRLDRTRRNDLFNDTWGYWQLDSVSDGRVLVTYSMGSQTVLPAFLTRGSERESVVKTVEALRARVERDRRPPEGQETGKGGGHVDRSSPR